MSMPAERSAAHRDSMPRPLVILSASFALIFMGTSALQPLMVRLTNEMTAFAVLAVVYTSFMVFRLTVPWSMEALGERASITLGAAIYAGYGVLLALTKDTWILVVGAVVWGWGAASLWTVSTVHLVEVSRRFGYGAAAGFFYMMSLGGQAVGTVVLATIMGRWGDTAAIWTASGLAAAGGVLTGFLRPAACVREKPRINEVLRATFERHALVVGLLLLCSSLGYGVLLGPVQAAVKNILERPWLLGFIPAAFYSTKSVMSYAGGTVSDRLGRRPVLTGGFLIGAVGLVVGASWPWLVSAWGTAPGLAVGVISLTFCSLALALQNALVPPTATAILGDTVKSERRPLMTAAMFFWRDFGIVLGLVGGMALRALVSQSEQLAMQAAFYGFAAVFVLCAALTFLLRETKSDVSADSEHSANR